MKNRSSFIVFILLILLAGCQVKKQIPTNKQTVLPGEEVYPYTESTGTPLPPGPVISKTKTETVLPETIPPENEIATAYPASEETPFEGAFDYPPPTFGPSPTMWPTHTATATPLPVDQTKIVQEKWDACRPEAMQKGAAIDPDPSLAGLVFSIDESLWKLDRAGRPVLLSCMPGSYLSPKGSQVSFVNEHGLWVANIKTGKVLQISNTPNMDPHILTWSPDEQVVYYAEQRTYSPDLTFLAGEIYGYDFAGKKTWPITNSPGVRKYNLRVWPAHPDWILYTFFPPDLQPGPGVEGNLKLVRSDGSGEQTLSKLHDYSTFSPDGETLIYYDNGSNWLYKFGQQPDPFEPNSFSWKDQRWESMRQHLLIWSPDGKRLAAAGNASNETGSFTGIIVFDLVTNQAVFLHPYTPLANEAGPGSPTWSPNSDWFVIYVQDSNHDRAGLWVIRSDGSEEHYLGGGGFLWSPDGERLLFYKGNEKPHLWIVNTKDWQLTQTRLPDHLRIVQWDVPE